MSMVKLNITRQNSWQEVLPTQTFGVDYNEIFTLVAKFVSICCILALQPLKTWKFESNLDNKTTFCNGDLDEEIYME